MMGNPIFILSKGRPECLSAKAFLEIDYPAEVTIVCGNDDETIPEYVKNYGKDRVVVFDKAEWWARCDMMDAYGMVGASGIAPVRNYIIQLARDKGYDRCWEFDDDIIGFRKNYVDREPEVMNSGEEVYAEMDKIESFARECGIPVVGYTVAPKVGVDAVGFGHNVGGIHNVTTEIDMLYRARIFEDAVCTQDLLRHGVMQYDFNFIQGIINHPWYGGSMAKRAHTEGGMKQQYDDMTEDGSSQDDKKSIVNLKVIAYTTMSLPRGKVLRIHPDGKMGQQSRERFYRPRVISQQWQRGVL